MVQFRIARDPHALRFPGRSRRRPGRSNDDRYHKGYQRHDRSAARSSCGRRVFAAVLVPECRGDRAALDRPDGVDTLTFQRILRPVCISPSRSGNRVSPHVERVAAKVLEGFVTSSSPGDIAHQNGGDVQEAIVARRHCWKAWPRKSRSVRREIRWRWTLKQL